jgi:hypothetical protein
MADRLRPEYGVGVGSNGSQVTHLLTAFVGNGFIDGGICTEKPDPGDVDGYWVEPGKAGHGTAEAELQSKTSKAAQIEARQRSAAIRKVASDAIGTTAPRIRALGRCLGRS